MARVTGTARAPGHPDSRAPGLPGTPPEKTIPGPQKYVKIIAFMAIIMGLGLLFYILLGFR